MHLCSLILADVFNTLQMYSICGYLINPSRFKDLRQIYYIYFKEILADLLCFQILFISLILFKHFQYTSFPNMSETIHLNKILILESRHQVEIIVLVMNVNLRHMRGIFHLSSYLMGTLLSSTFMHIERCYLLFLAIFFWYGKFHSWC